MDLHTLAMCVCWVWMQTVWGVDQVTLLNPPEEPVPGHVLRVLYSCSQPSTVQLDCVVSFDTGLTSTHLLRQWRCIPGGAKIRSLELNLPDWLVYRADGIVPDSQWVLSCMLLASVTHGGFDDSPVTAKDAAALQPKPFFDRPVKHHQLCSSWSTQMLHLTRHFSKQQCPLEQETAHLLSSIYASTGENFGITKTLEPYISPSLEYQRKNALSFPWCMISMWILVSRPCQARLCGLLYHIDSDNNYATPTLFLLNSGQLHVQVDGESGDSTAFRPHFKVPLSQWCQVSVMLHGSLVTVSMVCVDEGRREAHSVEHMMSHSVVLNDTDGYFVIGGGKYIRGVEGYFGPVIYYRNRISDRSMSEAAVPDVIQAVDLPRWLQACQAFHLEMTIKIHGFAPNQETCAHPFHEWTIKHKRPSECGLWEATVPHRKQAVKLIQALSLKRGGRGVSLPAVGRALFSLSLHKLSRASGTGLVSRILTLLLQAGCLADNRALHLSSVLYSSGLGVTKHPSKAWLLALLAAQQDDRLALLHLGHLHHQGRNGLPADQDLAYAYYANIAKQTTVDRLNHTPNQTFVEAVYLHNDEVLNAQTSEDHHIFQWLKLQARRGTAEAEQAVGRMLFWGQQGVAPNIQQAVRHYERGAVHLEDPQSMYDYGIVLLQGQGVERDIPRAVKFLKKAVDQGFVSAYSALGWYYEHFEKDYEQAVQLWEQGDLLKCPDAALNLGVIYSQGRYPGKAADLFMAYQYYQKAAQRGQIRAATLVADMWTTGIPGNITRRPLDAVLWAKWAAEHNGYMGTILRKALDSYLKSDMFSSLLYYMMAAECGYAPAQFNVAHLCEHNTLGFLDPAFASDCMWRYYNLTIQSQNPDTYAFIRMGDLLYEGHGNRLKDLLSAAEMYKLAALRNEPQGWYNLGHLVGEGFKLPMSILIELGLPQLYLADNSSLLSTLYIRCRDSGDADSYLPCSLALYHVHLQSFQKDYGAAIKVFTAVAVVAAPTLLLIVLGVFRRFLPAHS